MNFNKNALNSLVQDYIRPKDGWLPVNEDEIDDLPGHLDIIQHLITDIFQELDQTFCYSERFHGFHISN